jgi:FkbM family methyltransferase
LNFFEDFRKKLLAHNWKVVVGIIRKIIKNLLPYYVVKKYIGFESYFPSGKAESNEMIFDVSDENKEFWQCFNNRTWEPETVKFYRKYVSPDKEVIDIGGWIGPTVLIAYSFNPKKISVVEGDPANYQILKMNCHRNILTDKVELYNICIYKESGTIMSFGYNDETVLDTSTKGIGGKRVKVKTISLEDFLLTKDMENTNIIKIDIEGGEQYIEKGLKYISKYKDIVVLLSMHTPFWENKDKTAKMFLEILNDYEVLSDKEETVPTEKLKSLMYSEEQTGYRGKTGKFFTIILKTRE